MKYLRIEKRNFIKDIKLKNQDIECYAESTNEFIFIKDKSGNTIQYVKEKGFEYRFGIIEKGDK